MIVTIKCLSHKTFLAIWLCLGLSSWSAAEGPSAQEIGFNRSIRPILSDRCFSCHGPDSTKRKAGLRFDRRENAFGPLPEAPELRAFVPGHPERSEAYRRIMAVGTDDVMPPAKSHLKLNPQEKELFRTWIDQGAKWQEHWAFIAPVRPELPAVKDAAWVRNGIDRFVLAKLESQQLHPSPEADKATLIRRVSLDLTGIPPTPAEVDAFAADASPDAYEKLVDRLLASPRYGEQMATQWLDYARYADSHGFQSDPERFMWHWRDWVINAYNTNMPFDEFTVEQLAGDLLPNATVDQKIATGFNRNHRINGEGGIIAEEWRVDTVLDRAETTSNVWLGLTMGCARCHDHRFDPITQKDFYRFTGFFNSVNESGIADTGSLDRGMNVPPVLKLPTAEQKRLLEELPAAISRDDQKVKEIDAHGPELAAAWSWDAVVSPPIKGLVARFPLHGAVEGTGPDGELIPAHVRGGSKPVWGDGQGDPSLLLDGHGAVDAGQAVSFDGSHPFSYGAWVKLKNNTTAILSKMSPGPSFRGFDLRIENGAPEAHFIHNWPDNSLKVVATKPVPMDKWVHLMATYDGSRKGDGVKLYVDGQSQEFRREKESLSDSIATETPLLIGARFNSDPLEGMIADVEIYDRVLSAEEVGAAAARPVATSLVRDDPGGETAAGPKQTEALFRRFSPEVTRAAAQLAADKNRLEETNKTIPDTMIMEDLPKPRNTFVLVRGQYDKHGDNVGVGLPAVLPPLPAGQPMNRLGLARWIVDPGNPLTARVQVNRFWEKFFGAGIVKTSENMGTQAETPSHPELLDWLAAEFISEHWDVKGLLKLIVTSAAYRQSSATTPDLTERDPENRLIAHGPRVRLPAETVRDQALAASGLLVEKIGGPSVKPYEPANLWDGNIYGNLNKYVQDKGDSLYRRSLYTFWKRTAPPPNLSEFDEPTREYCVIKRSRSDTPLQALDLLNDPTYVEASRVLAARMLAEGGSTPVDRIIYGFKRVTCRKPTPDEQRILLAGLESHLERYRNDPASAAKLLSAGESPVDPSMNVPELAAYTMTSSVLLNLDEVVNKP